MLLKLEFPEFFKTHPTFICSSFWKASMHLNTDPFFWDTLYFLDEIYLKVIFSPNAFRNYINHILTLTSIKLRKTLMHGALFNNLIDRRKKICKEKLCQLRMGLKQFSIQKVKLSTSPPALDQVGEVDISSTFLPRSRKIMFKIYC